MATNNIAGLVCELICFFVMLISFIKYTHKHS